MMLRPHILVLLDLRWIAVQAGVGYYDITNDVFRPAFVDFVLWGKWRISFEAGRTSRLYR